eukprot:Gb_06676 [translate_table: standard]
MGEGTRNPFVLTKEEIAMNSYGYTPLLLFSRLAHTTDKPRLTRRTIGWAISFFHSILLMLKPSLSPGHTTAAVIETEKTIFKSNILRITDSSSVWFFETTMNGLGSLPVCDVPLHTTLDLRAISRRVQHIHAKPSNMYSTCSLNKNDRASRACMPTSTNVAAHKPKERAGECTYGDHNSEWLSHELQNLLSMQKEPSSGIVLTRGRWQWVLQESSLYQLRGIMRFQNVTKSNEVFISEVQGRLRLFSTECVDGISTSIQGASQLHAMIDIGLYILSELEKAHL